MFCTSAWLVAEAAKPRRALGGDRCPALGVDAAPALAS